MVVDSIRYCVNAPRKEDKLQPKNLFQVKENGREIQMFSFLLYMLPLCPSYACLFQGSSQLLPVCFRNKQGTTARFGLRGKLRHKTLKLQKSSLKPTWLLACLCFGQLPVPELY